MEASVSEVGLKKVRGIRIYGERVRVKRPKQQAAEERDAAVKKREKFYK